MKCSRFLHFIVVILITLEENLLCISVVLGEWWQETAGTIAAASLPHLWRTAVVIALAPVSDGARSTRRKVQHACHRLGHRADNAFANAGYQALL